MRNAGRWVILAWLLLAAPVALARQSFIGDGVRHVAYILDHSTPALGEARWLLFPAFLFAMLRPLHRLGWFDGVEGALRPFVLSAVAFAVVYLESLRRWLAYGGVHRSPGWLALALAASTSPLLLFATDTAEPLYAASLCALGLAMVACRGQLVFGLIVIAAASLLHQTVMIALFLLPLALGWERLLTRKALLAVLVTVLAALMVPVGTLMLSKDAGIVEAFQWVVHPYRNVVHENWMRGSLLKGVLLTWTAGIPQALVTIPGFAGMNGLLDGLRHLESSAFIQAFRLGVGFAAYVAGAAVAYRRRRWDLLLALAGFTILPTHFNNLYGYQKFYVLFPLLVAHTAVICPPRYTLAALALIGTLNVSALVIDVQQGRQRHGLRVTQYAAADAGTFWVHSGWGPDFAYLWPGRSCGMLRSLARPTTASTIDQLRAETVGDFTRCLEEAFCSGTAVWTDDWTAARAVAIEKTAAYHGLDPALLALTWWRGPADGASPARSRVAELFVFSRERQRRVCDDVRKLVSRR